MTAKTALKTTINRIKAVRTHGIKLTYYRDIYAKNILTTDPIVCGTDYSYEVHTLACERDLIHTLWSLKSFYRFCGANPPLVIYDDGSLSKNSMRILSEHFIHCTIIERRRFHHDMEDFLKSYPASLAHSRLQAFYCALKLFGPMRYTRRKRFLYFDSDVLFFQKPHELLKHIEKGKACYSSDYQDAYAHPTALLNDLLAIDMPRAVNAGLVQAAGQDFAGNLDLVENYFTEMPALDSKSWKVNRHEQTLSAILLDKAEAMRLGKNYQISKQPITYMTASHHFVNDGSRPDFYTKGLRQLKVKNFIRELKQPARQS